MFPLHKMNKLNRSAVSPGALSYCCHIVLEPFVKREDFMLNVLTIIRIISQRFAFILKPKFCDFFKQLTKVLDDFRLCSFYLTMTYVHDFHSNTVLRAELFFVTFFMLGCHEVEKRNTITFCGMFYMYLPQQDLSILDFREK